MTATDPCPALAAALAAEARAAASAEDMDAGPPPPDDRACADCHRAGLAQLDHLRQLLAVLDWSAAHMPEPEPEPEEEPWEPPPPAVPDYDGSEDEFHYCGEAWVGSRDTPEFRAWRERQNRRTEANIARCLDSAGSAGPDRRQAMTATPPHDKT